MNQNKTTAISTLRDQYENYPYPDRRAADEKKRLITGSPGILNEINHYLFGGQRDFSKPFRVLFAGGGTGDGTIMLAQQLADAREAGWITGEATVHYLDLSQKARETAEARAKARGLTNITFHTGSLLELPTMGLGEFDYIDCCGVLHHLPEPGEGLKALEAVLAPRGGIGIMVYGALGRSGLYPMQDALRRLTSGLPDLKDRVVLAKRVLADLPDTNGFKRNPFLNDHRESDAGLVDLLLHSCDRAYRVEQLYDLAQSAELQITSFVDPIRYRPETYTKDPKVRAAFAGLDRQQSESLAEELAGNLKVHIAYLTRQDDRASSGVARPEDDMLPVLRDMEAAQLGAFCKKNRKFPASADGLKLSLPLPRLAGAIAERCTGQMTVGEILVELQELDPRLDRSTFDQQFREFFDILNGINRLYLRRREI
ncbi:methyltransferase [Kiloniella sp. b19]|uniref:methyltransferase n=1 Tax=Kiloniella sp. GXU_MW_B19 TaxID=3141326 RepID=UPI0031D472FB